MSSGNTTKLRRLNGRLQACDPCRRRKIACDHGQPVCQRCRRRNWESHCTYTISARSVPPLDALQSQTSGSPPASLPDVSKSVVGRIPSVNNETVEPQTPSSVPRATPTPNSRAPGYLGYASYTTVLEEARKSLPVSEEYFSLRDDAKKRRSEVKISEAVLNSCVAVLGQIPTVENSAIPDKDSFHFSKWANIIALRILESLYDPNVFSAYIGKQRDEDSLRQMARMICINTAQPVQDSLDGDDWIAQFTGRNIRWESICLLFTFWDTTRRSLRTECNTPLDDEENWSKNRDAINRCLELCDEFSRGNLILVYVHHRRTRLETITSGDASLRSWKSHAQAVACLTFLGYHAEGSKEPYVPTLVSELKRLVCASVYGADKTLASFTGRPPLMPKAFTTTPLPLDLREEYLFGTQSHLETMASTTLNERGWSTEGKLTAATCYRSRGMLKTIREEILAIVLQNNQDVSIETLLKIIERQAAMIAEFPSSLTHHSDGIANPKVRVEIVLARLLTSMDALQNEFFVDRLLLKKGYDAQAHLLFASFKLVSDTLILWTNFERFATMKRDFEWILMAYGAPASGILCKELQKPSFRGRHPLDPRITRSSIIQKLSLLVGFLDWVDPLAPNADLCNDCSMVIQLVLDQALNDSIEAPSVAGQFEFDFPTALDFNFDLMDSFDWLNAEL